MKDRTDTKMYQFYKTKKVLKLTPFWLTFRNFICKIDKELGGKNGGKFRNFYK